MRNGRSQSLLKEGTDVSRDYILPRDNVACNNQNLVYLDGTKVTVKFYTGAIPADGNLSQVNATHLVEQCERKATVGSFTCLKNGLLS